MNWSDMSPRERDALVAEKVMGFVYPPNEWGVDTDFWYRGKGYNPNSDDSFVWVDAWRPSTDISAAWEVVEKIKEHGTDTVVIAAHGDGEWECELEGSLALSSAGARCPTAPEAICLAALRAVGAIDG